MSQAVSGKGVSLALGNLDLDTVKEGDVGLAIFSRKAGGSKPLCEKNNGGRGSVTLVLQCNGSSDVRLDTPIPVRVDMETRPLGPKGKDRYLYATPLKA